MPDTDKRGDRGAYLEKEIAELFNEYFPYPITGDLPGYEAAIRSLLASRTAEMLGAEETHRFDKLTVYQKEILLGYHKKSVQLLENALNIKQHSNNNGIEGRKGGK